MLSESKISLDQLIKFISNCSTQSILVFLAFRVYFKVFLNFFGHMFQGVSNDFKFCFFFVQRKEILLLLLFQLCIWKANFTINRSARLPSWYDFIRVYGIICQKPKNGFTHCYNKIHLLCTGVAYKIDKQYQRGCHVSYQKAIELNVMIYKSVHEPHHVFNYVLNIDFWKKKNTDTSGKRHASVHTYIYE